MMQSRKLEMRKMKMRCKRWGESELQGWEMRDRRGQRERWEKDDGGRQNRGIREMDEWEQGQKNKVNETERISKRRKKQHLSQTALKTEIQMKRCCTVCPLRWRGRTNSTIDEQNKRTRGRSTGEKKEGGQPNIVSSKLSLDSFHRYHVIAVRDALSKRKRLRLLAYCLLSCTELNTGFHPDIGHRWGDKNYHWLSHTGKWFNTRKAKLQSANSRLWCEWKLSKTIYSWNYHDPGEEWPHGRCSRWLGQKKTKKQKTTFVKI